MMLIQVSHREKQRIIRLGTARNKAKKREWTRRKADVFSDRRLDILGCLGEYAASEGLHVPMDWNVHPHGDKGIDLVTPRGTVAVKFNHRKKGYLIVEERDPDPWKDLVADYILLTHGRCIGKDSCSCEEEMNSHGPREVNVFGFLTAECFKRKSTWADWGLGGRFYVEVDELDQEVGYLSGYG